MKKLFYTLITLIALCLTAPHYAMNVEADDAAESSTDSIEIGADVSKRGRKRKRSIKSTTDVVAHKKATMTHPFVCRKCNKTFSCESRLTRHKRTHSDKRHFRCKYCPNKYKRNDHRREHIRKEHSHMLSAVKQATYISVTSMPADPPSPIEEHSTDSSEMGIPAALQPHAYEPLKLEEMRFAIPASDDL